jgi:rod shape-determining protein MreC
MYGIIAFFRRFYFTLLFIALEVISFAFVFTNNYFHEAGYFNSSSRIAGNVYKTYSGVTSYFSLQGVNRQLAEENVRLLNSFSSEKDTAIHKKVKVSNPYGEQYNFILAEVIDNSTNLPNNYLTLDAGSDAGVSEGMGIISPGGVVGVTVKVSLHYSVVMSLLHQKTLVSAMFKKSGTFGTLAWGDNRDYRFATLTQIPMSEKVKKGDTIVTSGFSSIFPRGIMVGTVDDFKMIPELYFYTVRIKLSTDFKNLRYVYAVTPIQKIEKDTLEKAAQNALTDKVKK